MTQVHTADAATGPARSARLRAMRDEYVSRSVSHATPVIADSASGVELWDVEGKRYLDFAGGIGTLNVGHTHPAVVRAITAQANRLVHAMFSVALYEPYIELAAELARLTPGAFPKKSVLVNSGAEAVENGIKIARAATGRSTIIAFTNAFHGRTLMTMALTHKETPYKDGFGPFPPEVVRLPLPDLYRPTFPENEVDGCLGALGDYLDAHPNDVAAIIFEPVQGEGGFIVAPDAWMQGVAKLAKRHGVVLIADEIQTGFGRTGRWFAVEHAGIEPDLILMAKSLAGGMPLAAVTGRAELLDAPVVGGLGGTFGGNPVSCAAALAVIDVMRAEGLVGQAIEIGQAVEARMRAWQREYALIGDVRGRGAMMAMELVRDRATKEPAKAETAAILKDANDRGLIALSAGHHGNVIRCLVPLTVTDAELDEGLGILGESLTAVSPRV